MSKKTTVSPFMIPARVNDTVVTRQDIPHVSDTRQPVIPATTIGEVLARVQGQCLIFVDFGPHGRRYIDERLVTIIDSPGTVAGFIAGFVPGAALLDLIGEQMHTVRSLQDRLDNIKRAAAITHRDQMLTIKRLTAECDQAIARADGAEAQVLGLINQIIDEARDPLTALDRLAGNGSRTGWFDWIETDPTLDLAAEGWTAAGIQLDTEGNIIAQRWYKDNSSHAQS